MTFPRVNDSTARAPRSFENALQRLDERPRRVDVVAHLVHITSMSTKVDLHIDQDDGRLRWVQVSIKREGVGLGLDLGHGSAALLCLRSGQPLSRLAKQSLSRQAPARYAMRFLVFDSWWERSRSRADRPFPDEDDRLVVEQYAGQTSGTAF